MLNSLIAVNISLPNNRANLTLSQTANFRLFQIERICRHFQKLGQNVCLSEISDKLEKSSRVKN